MTNSEIQQLLNYADESHRAAKVLMAGGFIGFAAAQSYYSMLILTEFVVLEIGLAKRLTQSRKVAKKA